MDNCRGGKFTIQRHWVPHGLLDNQIYSKIQEHMQKQILSSLVLCAVLGFIPAPVFAIDGDMGNPYASDQQTPAPPRAPGEAPVYGGRDAPVPFTTLLGGALIVFGVGAAGWWQLKSARQSRANA